MTTKPQNRPSEDYHNDKKFIALGKIIAIMSGDKQHKNNKVENIVDSILPMILEDQFIIGHQDINVTFTPSQSTVNAPTTFLVWIKTDDPTHAKLLRNQLNLKELSISDVSVGKNIWITHAGGHRTHINELVRILKSKHFPKNPINFFPDATPTAS